MASPALPSRPAPHRPAWLWPALGWPAWLWRLAVGLNTGRGGRLLRGGWLCGVMIGLSAAPLSGASPHPRPPHRAGEPAGAQAYGITGPEFAAMWRAAASAGRGAADKTSAGAVSPAPAQGSGNASGNAQGNASGKAIPAPGPAPSGASPTAHPLRASRPSAPAQVPNAPQIAILPLDTDAAMAEQAPTQPKAAPPRMASPQASHPSPPHPVARQRGGAARASPAKPEAPLSGAGVSRPPAMPMPAPMASVGAMAPATGTPAPSPAQPTAPALTIAPQEPPLPHQGPLARRIAPRPLAPPDLAIIAALRDWPGGGWAMVVEGLLMACAGALLLRRLAGQTGGTPAARAALPAPKAPGALLHAEPVPSEPRPPRRAECRNSDTPVEAEPRPAFASKGDDGAQLSGQDRLPQADGAEPPGMTSPTAPRDVATRDAAPPDAARTGHRAGPRAGSRKRGGTARAPAARPSGQPPRPLDETLTLGFTPLRFSATLAQAVLTYRLSVTNGGQTALGPVTITGGMIAAEVAPPTASLMAGDFADLAPLHTMAALAPGESVDLRGELRVALASVTPMRVGGAALMVPLVRLKLVAGRQGRGRKAVSATQAGSITRLAQFIVGEPDGDGAEAEGADARGPDRLHPFRLDLGPRSWAAVAQGGLDLVPDAVA